MSKKEKIIKQEQELHEIGLKNMQTEVSMMLEMAKSVLAASSNDPSPMKEVTISHMGAAVTLRK